MPASNARDNRRAVSVVACAALLLASCGGSGGGGGDSTPPPPPGGTVTLSGRVTFDRVPFAVAGTGLDYAATVAAPVREADVQLIQSNQAVLGATRTDADGRYQFVSVPAATDVYVRVLARTRNDPAISAGATWDIEIRDNTNANAQYVLDGAVFNTGAANGTPTRDLNAPSGWPQFGGTSYVAPRSAGPFAILDTVYEALQLVVVQGDADLVLEPLDVFWSPDNVPASGDPAAGEIVTTSYVSIGGSGNCTWNLRARVRRSGH